MLPFQPRPPRYGNRAENAKRKNESTFGGGPVQNAIKADLVGLLERVRVRMNTANQQHQQQNHPHQHPPNYTPRRHWESGTAFSIFKQEFASSKAGIIHLLHPPRCDREAYSQLVYAACFDLLKQSFLVFDESQRSRNDDQNAGDERILKLPSLSLRTVVDDASFAVFSLWALFDTNPLPREVPCPLQLLPVGLRSFEDPRTLYRRYFSQNIRIDRQHYILLMRLRELALASRASCQEAMLELCRWDLEGKAKQSGSQHDPTPSWECSCGMSTDVITVLERVFPILDLCEYTGPVGLEAFAGHGDFPYTQDQPTIRKQQLPRLEHETCQLPAFEPSSVIPSLIDKYQRSIDMMHVPGANSSLVSRRLKESLQPLLSSGAKVRWDDIRVRLFSNLDQTRSQPSRPSYIGDSSNSSTLVGKRCKENEMAETSSERKNENLSMDSTKVQIEQNPETQGVAQSGIYSYVLDLRGIMDGDLEKHLIDSLNFLLQRDQPLALPGVPQGLTANGSESLLSADNVSSIGNAESSVGIDDGRIAIRSLLGAAGKYNANPVLGSDQLFRGSRQSAANIFLTSNQEMASGQSDDESLGSDVTNPSFSDFDGEQEDDHSVATTAVGRQALEILLTSVRQGQEGGHTSTQSQSKRKMASVTSVTNKKLGRRKKRNSVDDASSIEQGQAALSVLLGKALSRKKTKLRSSNGKRTTLQSSVDDVSTTSSFGQGQKALHALLSHVSGTTNTASI